MKNLACIFLLLVASVPTIGQPLDGDARTEPKFFEFGMSIGINHSYLSSSEPLPGNAKIINGIGVNLGFLAEYPISDRLLISPKAGLSFNKSQVDFQRADNSKYRLFQSSLDLMFHMIYRLKKGEDKPYLLLGIKQQLPFSKKPRVSSNFDSNNDNTAIDVGIGINKLGKKRILNPELRYSIGIINVNRHPLLGALNYHSLSLLLKFKKH